MVGKTLPYYYIIILWVVAFVSVFLIVKPLIYSNTENNIFSESGNDSGGNLGHKQITESNKGVAVSSKEKNDSNDLIFYDKTAFIRYFSDKFSPEELSTTYNEAVGGNADTPSRPSIKVVRKGNAVKSSRSFSGSFDIKPLPGLSKK